MIQPFQAPRSDPMPASKAMYRLIPSSDPVGIVPPQPVEGEAAVALAFVIALLRALRDRGTLSRAEVDDVLNDVHEQVAGKASYLVETVRRDLEREDDE
jgi:hypothetical protein